MGSERLRQPRLPSKCESRTSRREGDRVFPLFRPLLPPRAAAWLSPVRGLAAAVVLGLLAAQTASSSTSTRHVLTNARVAHWAPVLRRAAVHSAPTAKSSVLTRLPSVTPERTQNIVLVLASVGVAPGQAWYDMRVPILPNNSTGWVPWQALGSLKVSYWIWPPARAFNARLLVWRSRWARPARPGGASSAIRALSPISVW